MFRAPYPGNSSIYSLIEKKVLPLLVGTEADTIDRISTPRFILTNTGSIRYDLLKGQFTKDTGYIVSPFPNTWVYIPSVPIEKAQKILKLLNRQDTIVMQSSVDSVDATHLDFNDLGIPSGRSFKRDYTPDSESVFALDDYSISEGYVTYDDYGHDGDDTEHKSIPYYRVPNVVQATQNVDEDNTWEADVIFYDFMIPFMRQIFVDELDMFDSYDDFQVQVYGGFSFIDLLPQYFSNDRFGEYCQNN